jgi:hypothetical protein
MVFAMGAPTQAQEMAARTIPTGDAEERRAWAESALEAFDSGSEGDRSSSTTALNTTRLWALYFLSVDEKKWIGPATALADSLSAVDVPEPRHVQGLMAAVEVVRAKHARWPPNKVKHLRKGLSLLDRLVEASPEEPGLRFLRLVSGYYLPFFLDRSKEVEEDFRVLTSILPGRDHDLPPQIFRFAVGFVLKYGEIEGPERSLLQEALGAP